jgi:hypothetical protein
LKPSIAAQPEPGFVAVVVADVAKIRAAGALQDIAAERRHIAQLRTDGKLQRIRDHRVAALDLGIRRDIGHPRQCTQPQIVAVKNGGRPGARQRIDVDDVQGAHDIELHQVDQRGTAGERLGGRCRQGIVACRISGQRLGGGCGISCPLIGKRSHVTSLSGSRGRPASRLQRCSDTRRSGRDCRSYIRGCHRRWSHALLHAGDRGHDLSRRAIAALESVLVDEGLLHRVRMITMGKTFDGRDFLILRCKRQSQARHHTTAIDQHRAGAALAVVAPLLAAGQADVLAEHRARWCADRA